MKRFTAHCFCFDGVLALQIFLMFVNFVNFEQ